MKKAIKKHVLLNAIEYEGKANAQAVLGKVLAEKPELKKDITRVAKEISKTLNEVNSWGLERQKKELKKFGKITKLKKVEREGLPPLPNAKKGKVITRFPPFPSGSLHIGNMKAVVLSYEYAKMYKGKFLVRIEDTDPNPEKVKKENVEFIKKDLKVMEIKWDKFYLCSSRFKKHYKLSEKLIEHDKVYVCTCPPQKGVKGKYASISKKECDCRSNSIETNSKLWKKMISKKFKPQEAVLRLRTDINDPNPALRDPIIMRIKSGKNPTTGKEHWVYPSYNFNAAVEDHDEHITHILRGTEHAFNTIIQRKVYDALGWKKYSPVTINFGFMYMPGKKVHKRYIRDAIAKGKFSGWDDPKLGQYGLIRALIKRGIKPQAIKNMIIEMGVNLQTVTFQWEKLYTENRKIIDKESKRYFFVSEPIAITLDRLVQKKAKAPIFPRKRKYRTIPTSKKIFVEKIDFTQNREKEVRLMHFCNIILNKKSKVTSKKLKDIPKIHWMGTKNVKVRLIMPDGKIIQGLSEPEIKKVKPGDTVQFERIGFARCEKPKLFYFAHK
jgi:glutamyl-tRNA synthetase